MSYPNSCFMWKEQTSYQICVNKHALDPRSADRLCSGASVLRASRSLHCHRKPIDTRKFGLEVSVQRTHVQTVGEGESILYKWGEEKSKHAACVCLKEKLTSVEATNGVPVRTFCLTDVTKGLGKYMLWFNFILGLNYSFFCFVGLVMYDNELKTNKKIKPRIKVDHNMYFASFAFSLVTLLVTL